MEILLFLLVPPGFIAFWCGVVFLISLVSGWRKLAAHFQTIEKPQGRIFLMQRARLNGADYKGCLTLGVAPQGLYLKLWPLFSSGHAPLLIPWSAFSAFKTQKSFWLLYHTTTITTPSGDKISLGFFDPPIVEAMRDYLPSCSLATPFS